MKSNCTGELRVHADELKLASGDGSLLTPSAEQIFAYAFQAETTINGITVTRVRPDSLQFSKFPLDLRLHVRAQQRGSNVVVSLATIGTLDNVSVEIPNVLERQSSHIVHGDVWYPFAKGALEEVRTVIRDAAITNLQELTLRQYLELTQIGLRNSLVRDETGHVLDAGSHSDAVNSLALPGFRGQLYPYQETGCAWLNRLTDQGIGSILADEMGLGKTIQIIALLVSQTPHRTAPSLIVAPATILENWRRELARFAPTLKVELHRGGNRTGFPARLRVADLVLSSYDTVVRDLALFKMVQWNLVIVDEAQSIKNPQTKRTIGLKSVPRSVGIAVTGTPLENRLTDLWSIVDFVLPGFLGEQRRFESSFANVPSDAERLEPLVSPILLRRRISEVAQDLPPRIDIPQALELPPSEAEEYEKLRSNIEAEYGDSATLVAIGKLRQFCAHPLQLTGGWGDPTERSTKYVRVLEILEEIFSRREKVLVFLQYHHTMDLFVTDLAKRVEAYTDWIDGRIDASGRQWKIDKFNEYSGPAVLLLNPRTAGTGLNLDAANHVIHYSPDWNPAVEDQASARAHRRGQTRPVTVHRLFFANTVEEIIVQRLGRKRELANKAVIGTSGQAEDRSDILKALRASPVKGSI